MFAEGDLVSGRYRILRLIGRGGMGEVWAARNEAISRDVAIKVLLSDFAAHTELTQRFFAEARICGSLRHPGVVDVLDMGTADDGAPYIVMEMLEGESLGALIARHGRLAPALILPIVRDIARTLALTHDKGIIHRDLKPDNIFLHRVATGKVVAKVLDFGISKVQGGDANLKLTRTGTVFGSPMYMSPEQAAADAPVDARSDIYSLGVILYEALSGRLPFDDPNYNSLIISIVTRPHPDIATLVPELPREIAGITRDAMAKDREKRIQKMSNFADRIDKVLGPGEVVPDWTSLHEGLTRSAPFGRAQPERAFATTVGATMGSSFLRPSVRGTWLALGGLLVLFVLAIGGYVFVSSRSSAGDELAAQSARIDATALPTSVAPSASPSALVPSVQPGVSPGPSAPVIEPAATAPSPADSLNSSMITSARPTDKTAAPARTAQTKPATTATAAATGKTSPPKPSATGIWGYDN